MKNKQKIIVGIIIVIILIIGGVLGTIGVKKMVEPSTREKQISFLKAHENELEEYIKLQKFYVTSENKKNHPKVENVSFNFDDYDTYQRDAGGIPTDIYTIDLTGIYNGNEEFELLIDVDSLTNPTKILNFERY